MKDYFNKLSDRERKMLGLLAVLILCFGMYALVFEGNIRVLNDKKDQLASLETREENLSMELFSYGLLNERYSGYNMDELEKQLPSQGRVPEIILWLDDLFKRGDLSTPTMGFSVASNEVEYMQITLTFSGSYRAIFNLVEEIESSKRLTAIERINLSGSQDSLTANMVIHVYGQDFADIGQGEFDYQNSNLFRGN